MELEPRHRSRSISTQFPREQLPRSSPIASILFAGALALAGLGCGAPFIDYNGGPGGGDGGGGGGRYHPDGWDESEAHGISANLQEEDCRDCHGVDLTGGTDGEESCDECHDDGWRTDCAFCHGSDSSGVPPRDINGVSNPAMLSFLAHDIHLVANISPNYDCAGCHVNPDDVLTPDHAFDSTPAVSEVVFTGSPGGNTYDGNGSCSASYCHGNGRGNNGSVTHTDGPMECNSCHPMNGSGMSGEHSKHVIDDNEDCFDCHGSVVNVADAITDVSLHVDGAVSILMSEAGMSWNGNSCNGPCHGHNHQNQGW